MKNYESLFNEIYPITQEHLRPYYKLLSQHSKLSPRDAIHIAVMQSQGLKTIYTTDKAFKRVKGLKVIEP